MPRDDYSHSNSPHRDRDCDYRHRDHRASRSKSPGYDRDLSRDRNRHRERDRDRGRECERSHRHRSRSRSYSRDNHGRHHNRHRRKPTRSPSTPLILPYNARQLTKYDLEECYDLFADYLDIQKGLAIEDLDKLELRGRFKSFIGHWNRGELAKGWYDPSRKKKNNIVEEQAALIELFGPPGRSESKVRVCGVGEQEGSSDEEIVGPVLPGHEPSERRVKVSLPTMEDLDLQKEKAEEDAELVREQLRHDRKHDRKLQKERLEELVPRADPGSRERRLEKKKELNEKMRSFRDRSPGAGLEVNEDTLMGGGTDSFKAMKAAKERKKNERELRKEAMLRQRIEEREARLQRHKEKEEKTVMMLKAMAESSMYAKKANII